MYEPKPEDKFTFWLWTVDNVGADPSALARRGYSYKRLDQLTVELLLGAR